MRFREPFRVFPKKIASGRVIYYYTTYDIFNKRRQYSTGQESKSRAYQYCLDLFKNNELLEKKEILFSEYTKDWFDYENCPYIQNLILRGKTYSKSNARQFRSRLLKSIIPFFGELYLHQIKPKHVEIWIQELKKQNLSNTTVNAYITTLKLILNFAVSRGDINHNSLSTFKLLKKDSKVSTTLDTDEISKLFNKRNIKRIWSSKLFFTINYLASKTGMRLGEIQALQMNDIKEDHIKVRHNWERIYGLKPPKNGKSRIVPITKEIFNLLSSMADSTDSNFIFSHRDISQPVSSATIIKRFNKAINNIGIDEKTRKERNISFHSWRHYYNTQLIKKGVPLPIIQAVIGHSSNSMTDKYTKLTKDDLSVILD